jgi:hypothetical protein
MASPGARALSPPAGYVLALDIAGFPNGVVPDGIISGVGKKEPNHWRRLLVRPHRERPRRNTAAVEGKCSSAPPVAHGALPRQDSTAEACGPCLQEGLVWGCSNLPPPADPARSWGRSCAVGAILDRFWTELTFSSN